MPSQCLCSSPALRFALRIYLLLLCPQRGGCADRTMQSLATRPLGPQASVSSSVCGHTFLSIAEPALYIHHVHPNWYVGDVGDSLTPSDSLWLSLSSSFHVAVSSSIKAQPCDGCQPRAPPPEKHCLTCLTCASHQPPAFKMPVTQFLSTQLVLQACFYSTTSTVSCVEQSRLSEGSSKSLQALWNIESTVWALWEASWNRRMPCAVQRIKVSKKTQKMGVSKHSLSEEPLDASRLLFCRVHLTRQCRSQGWIGNTHLSNFINSFANATEGSKDKFWPYPTFLQIPNCFFFIVYILSTSSFLDYWTSIWSLQPSSSRPAQSRVLPKWISTQVPNLFVVW